MKRFLKVLVFLMISQVPAVNQGEVVGHEPIHAKVGDDVTLPCHLEPPFDVNNLTIEWRFQGKEILVHHSQAEKDETSDPKYQNRTSMFHDEFKKGNISLKLTNVSKEDGGNYTCFVPKLQSQVRKGNVTLYVGENGAPDIVIGPEGPDGGVNVGWVVVVVVGGFVLLILIFITICVVRRPRDSQRWSNNSRNEEVRNDGEMETEQFQNHRGNSNQGDEAEPLQNQEEPNQSV